MEIQVDYQEQTIYVTDLEEEIPDLWERSEENIIRLVQTALETTARVSDLIGEQIIEIADVEDLSNEIRSLSRRKVLAYFGLEAEEETIDTLRDIPELREAIENLITDRIKIKLSETLDEEIDDLNKFLAERIGEKIWESLAAEEPSEEDENLTEIEVELQNQLEEIRKTVLEAYEKIPIENGEERLQELLRQVIDRLEAADRRISSLRTRGSTETGFGFENDVGIILEELLPEKTVEHVGMKAGIIGRSKKGDYVVTDEESGLIATIECKTDKSVSKLPKIRKEMEGAMKNRNARIGIFITSVAADLRLFEDDSAIRLIDDDDYPFVITYVPYEEGRSSDRNLMSTNILMGWKLAKLRGEAILLEEERAGAETEVEGIRSLLEEGEYLFPGMNGPDKAILDLIGSLKSIITARAEVEKQSYPETAKYYRAAHKNLSKATKDFKGGMG